ncbi:MAG: beta-lactamase family protein [Oscillospiraceae bacterium]|nr:beta-lactamase family protein [Oscillospiraceae bacterium]
MRRHISAVLTSLVLFSGCAADRSGAPPETSAVTTTAETEAEETSQTTAETSSADITDGLIYDESSNTWSTQNEELQGLARVMASECAKSPDIKGTYLLATDDEIVFIGGIDSEDIYGNKADAYTTYEIGSITKTFTATAILQLVEQGKLSLDDTLDKFFPEYEYGKDITIYHLLHMRSGIRPDFLDQAHGLVEGDTNNEAFEQWKKYFKDGFTDEELLSELFSAEPDFGPGEQYAYSNAGYGLLAMIIEQVTGESYADYIQTNIFDVCGMEHSSSMATGDVTSIPQPVPEGMYAFDMYDLTPTGYMACPRTWRGAGDIHTCAADMLAFDRALIGGKLINDASLAEMFNMDDLYGCGWEQLGANYLTNDTFCHAGATHFFRSFNVYYQTEGYGNVYMIQLHPGCADQQYLSESVFSIRTALRT